MGPFTQSSHTRVMVDGRPLWSKGCEHLDLPGVGCRMAAENSNRVPPARRLGLVAETRIYGDVMQLISTFFALSNPELEFVCSLFVQRRA